MNVCIRPPPPTWQPPQEMYPTPSKAACRAKAGKEAMKVPSVAEGEGPRTLPQLRLLEGL